MPHPQQKITLLTLKYGVFVYCDQIFEAWIDTVTPFSSLYTPPQSHRIYANLAGRPGGGWGVRTPGPLWTPPRLTRATAILVSEHVHIWFNEACSQKIGRIFTMHTNDKGN